MRTVWKNIVLGRVFHGTEAFTILESDVDVPRM